MLWQGVALNAWRTAHLPSLAPPAIGPVAALSGVAGFAARSLVAISCTAATKVRIAQHGMAWHGMAWRGVAWRGVA
jgi:hypothetical protein